jgi:hypothetical protein
MPVVDLGVDYTDVQNEDKFEPLPGGTYDFTIAAVESKQSAKGRPMIKWKLAVNHDGQRRVLFYNTVLPWDNPETGELDAGGVGMLVGLCKAVGKPWTGSSIDTDSYVGLGGTAEVVQKPGRSQDPATGEWVEDPNADPQNDVKKFVY